jgi:hypothetical protein
LDRNDSSLTNSSLNSFDFIDNIVDLSMYKVHLVLEIIHPLFKLSFEKNQCLRFKSLASLWLDSCAKSGPVFEALSFLGFESLLQLILFDIVE